MTYVVCMLIKTINKLKMKIMKRVKNFVKAIIENLNDPNGNVFMCCTGCIPVGFQR